MSRLRVPSPIAMVPYATRNGTTRSRSRIGVPTLPSSTRRTRCASPSGIHRTAVNSWVERSARLLASQSSTALRRVSPVSSEIASAAAAPRPVTLARIQRNVSTVMLCAGPSRRVGLGDPLAGGGALARGQGELAGPGGRGREGGVGPQGRPQRRRLVPHVAADVHRRADGGQDGEADGAALQQPGGGASQAFAAARRKGTRSKAWPRISFASAPRWVFRISW